MYVNTYPLSFLMKTISPSDARADLFNLIKKAIKGNKPIRITSKEGTAILISEDDYEGLLETIELFSVPGLRASLKDAEKDIAEGKVYSLEEVFRE